MAFCTKCGKQIKEDAAFCQYCGNKIPVSENRQNGNYQYKGEQAGDVYGQYVAPTSSFTPPDKNRKWEQVQQNFQNSRFSKNTNIPYRKEENTIPKETKQQEESVRRCPNCNGPLSSLELVCPWCGAEIQTQHRDNVMRDFFLQMNTIEQKKHPTTFFGTIATSVANKVDSNYEDKIEREKVALIANFPVPSDRQNIHEFGMFAISNFNVEDYLTGVDVKHELAVAWYNKMEQIYQKTMLYSNSDSDFEKFTSLYLAKKKEIERRQSEKKEHDKKMYKIMACVGVGIFLLLIIVLLVN